VVTAGVAVVECPRDTAGKGYTGGEHVITPYKGRDKPPSRKAANRTHAKLRGPGERASTQLKTWRILEELRCCPWKAGQLAKASTSSNTTRSEDEKRSLSVLAVCDLVNAAQPSGACNWNLSELSYLNGQILIKD
jgi:hypothetical protein